VRASSDSLQGGEKGLGQLTVEGGKSIWGPGAKRKESKHHAHKVDRRATPNQQKREGGGKEKAGCTQRYFAEKIEGLRKLKISMVEVGGCGQEEVEVNFQNGCDREASRKAAGKWDGAERC